MIDLSSINASNSLLKASRLGAFTISCGMAFQINYMLGKERFHLLSLSHQLMFNVFMELLPYYKMLWEPK